MWLLWGDIWSDWSEKVQQRGEQVGVGEKKIMGSSVGDQQEWPEIFLLLIYLFIVFLT